jgi:flagellar biosynthesis protein FlhA
VIVIPVPAALMDMLLATNITVAVIMLLTTLYVRTPLEFSVFPSLLLATTLFRLVLNVATTRLILTHGASARLLAAGQVICTFGKFVAGDNVVVGLIIFAIIIVIQFVVITKGAARISEVAARFTLDGMPGLQMAIDADLNAGMIDDREAQRRRQEITRRADFFGAMDGASKFVRGDAVASILITLINIVGGLFIGVVQAGMAPQDAAGIFTKLTIGDGLVTQVPAFLISLAAGLLVTRSSYETNLPSEFLRQLFSRPQALLVAAAFLGILVFTTLPPIPLVLLGAGCVGLAVTLRRREAQVQVAEEVQKKAATAKPQARVEDFLHVDPMEIELGVGLIRLADPQRGGDLLDRIHRIRQNVAAEIGIVLPKVRIRDSFKLQQQQYRLKIADLPVAEATVQPEMLLAIGAAAGGPEVPGTPARDPVSGAAAVWIHAAMRQRAERSGCRVVEPGAVIAAHVTETIRRHADEILTRDATRHLIEELKKTSPAVVEELIPATMKLAEVQQVLQMLLREQVPIRQFEAILETLGDYAPRCKDPIVLAEMVRTRLARTISMKYCDRENRLWVVTLDPAIEDRIRAGFEQTERGILIRMPPQAVEDIVRAVGAEAARLTAAGHPPVVLVSPAIRAALRQMTVGELAQLVVLSYNEITRDVKVESVAMVSEESAFGNQQSAFSNELSAISG